MSDKDPNGDRMARFRLVLPENPESNDVLHLEFNFLEGRIRLRLMWPDSDRNEVLNLLEYARPMLEKCHLEYEVARQATEIDKDLGLLFPDEGDGE